MRNPFNFEAELFEVDSRFDEFEGEFGSEFGEFDNEFADWEWEAKVTGKSCRGFEIDSVIYIKWVQRSLNRILGSGLAVDGRVSEKYRNAVRRFQQSRGLKPTGDVDPSTQNKLILANEKSKPYVEWIQKALNISGARIVSNRVKGPNTTKAIKDFQKKRVPDLCVDGFVGAKTELRLIPAGCGVPRRAILGEILLELGIENLEQQTSSATVRPWLCLFQNSSDTTHRNHFQCGALRQARGIGAIASPDASNCRRCVGATPYDTGAGITNAIEAAHQCLGERAIDVVHIFSHGFSSGVAGTTIGFAGLYQDAFSIVERSEGGRTVSDIPAARLSNNVLFVLHGCNIAAGSDNFARSLYEYLAASLSNPRVYGHHNSGCAGRNNSWREYSNRHPTGRNPRSLSNIASVQCCGT